MDGIEATVEALKAQGNDAYRNKRYEVAAKFYSEAIDAAMMATPASASSTTTVVSPVASLLHLHLLYSNRGQAHLQLNRPADALRDAISSINANPKWLKGSWIE